MLIGLLIAVAAVLGAVALMLLMRRFAPGGEKWFRDGSVAGGALGAVRSPFAVLMAFVVFLAFQGYLRAREASREEAAAVATMIRSSALVPKGGPLDGALVCYGRAVISQEWPAMRAGDAEGSIVVSHWEYQIEQAMGALELETPVEQQALANLFDETNNRERARADRLSEAEGTVPMPVWIVLIASGLMIIIYVSFLADPAERRSSQVMMSGAVALIVVSGLLLVGFFATPFADRPGGLEPTAMRTALDEANAAQAPASLPCDEAGIPLND